MLPLHSLNYAVIVIMASSTEQALYTPRSRQILSGIWYFPLAEWKGL